MEGSTAKSLPQKKSAKKLDVDEEMNVETRERVLERKRQEKLKQEKERQDEVKRFLAQRKAAQKDVNEVKIYEDLALFIISPYDMLEKIKEWEAKGYAYLDAFTYGQMFYMLMKQTKK
jgi:hypothetical protein